jgi:hypothetical protein
VFILLAYLLWIGTKRLKPGVRELAKIAITPAIFIVWGVIGLFQRPGDFSTAVAQWAARLQLRAAPQFRPRQAQVLHHGPQRQDRCDHGHQQSELVHRDAEKVLTE